MESHSLLEQRDLNDFKAYISRQKSGTILASYHLDVLILSFFKTTMIIILIFPEAFKLKGKERFLPFSQKSSCCWYSSFHEQVS